jgi:hypothetical protein
MAIMVKAKEKDDDPNDQLPIEATLGLIPVR